MTPWRSWTNQTRTYPIRPLGADNSGLRNETPPAFLQTSRHELDFFRSQAVEFFPPWINLPVRGDHRILQHGCNQVRRAQRNISPDSRTNAPARHYSC